jgi:hypothetical protein
VHEKRPVKEITDKQTHRPAPARGSLLWPVPGWWAVADEVFNGIGSAAVVKGMRHLAVIVEVDSHVLLDILKLVMVDGSQSFGLFHV